MKRFLATFFNGIAWRWGAIVAVAIAGYLVEVFSRA